MSTAIVIYDVARMISFLFFSRFEYTYVYNHSSNETELIYRISALWSGQEGSFLLWALILTIMGLFMLRMRGKGIDRAFGIYSVISSCILFMCFIVTPFAKAPIFPPDGLGLNEALKDPWMIVHPPLVFISYSAMGILFSLSATLYGNINEEVTERILLWLRISWFFLGVGILSGSIWAYRALGWGGYWSWDPIENAAFVPWLVLCAFLHGKEYQKPYVSIVPFSIACFGVFLARSGILKDQSAHAYADGNIIVTGIIFLIIFGAVLFLSIARIRKSKNRVAKVGFSIYDKRLITYSICIYAVLIFIGTIAPLFSYIKTPVSYYTFISIVFISVYITLILLWDLLSLKSRNISMIAVSTILVSGIIILTRSARFWWLLLLWFCLMPISLWLVSGFKTKCWSYYIAHLGILLLVIGSVGSSALDKEEFALYNQDSSSVIVSGIGIPAESLAEKEVLIKSFPMEDIVIKCSKIVPLSQGSILVPYVKKPLIILFWIGSVLIIAQPVFRFIPRRQI
jgi:cytochrome c-type biogenesis protein CcmF